MDKKTVKMLSIICLVAALAVIVLTPDLSSQPTPSFREENMLIHLKDHDIRLGIEIAETTRQQAYGFMHRTNIPADHGMLFIWSNEAHIAMWMKDTPLPLDMLFLDQKGKVVYIFENAPPYSEQIIDTKLPVRAVIELLGGTVAAQQIKVGDQVEDNYFHSDM